MNIFYVLFVSCGSKNSLNNNFNCNEKNKEYVFAKSNHIKTLSNLKNDQQYHPNKKINFEVKKEVAKFDLEMKEKQFYNERLKILRNQNKKK